MKELAKMVLEQYIKEYDFLYDNYDNVAGYDEAFEYGEYVLRTDKEMVRALCEMRGDIFSSDREIAALGFAYNEIIG